MLDQLERSVVETFDATWMRGRLQERIDRLKNEHVEAARALIARWPADTPMLKKSDAHTPQQLTAIDRALSKVEADFGVPF